MPSTIEAAEIDRFQALADKWWDLRGPFAPLHRFNPARLGILRTRLLDHFGRDPASLAPFAGLRLLDIGCGGGLLSEPLSRMGFAVTGIDAGEGAIEAARRHAASSGLAIDYRHVAAEDMSESFDVVLAMEVVEHVPDPRQFIEVAAARLKPGGAFVASTLNRTVRAYLLAVLGAEYVLRWLPRGTHDWRKFVRPSELAFAMRAAGIRPGGFDGMALDPRSQEWTRTASLAVNYLAFGKKDETAS